MPISYQDFIFACQQGQPDIVKQYVNENPIEVGEVPKYERKIKDIKDHPLRIAVNGYKNSDHTEEQKAAYNEIAKYLMGKRYFNQTNTAITADLGIFGLSAQLGVVDSTNIDQQEVFCIRSLLDCQNPDKEKEILADLANIYNFKATLTSNPTLIAQYLELALNCNPTSNPDIAFHRVLLSNHKGLLFEEKAKLIANPDIDSHTRNRKIGILSSFIMDICTDDDEKAFYLREAILYFDLALQTEASGPEERIQTHYSYILLLAKTTHPDLEKQAQIFTQDPDFLLLDSHYQTIIHSFLPSSEITHPQLIERGRAPAPRATNECMIL